MNGDDDTVAVLLSSGNDEQGVWQRWATSLKALLKEGCFRCGGEAQGTISQSAGPPQAVCQACYADIFGHRP